MNVTASLWFESPGALPSMQAYQSIKSVREDFADMVKSWNRLGGSKPVGAIYARNNHDYPLYTLEVTDRGAIRQTKA